MPCSRCSLLTLSLLTFRFAKRRAAPTKANAGAARKEQPRRPSWYARYPRHALPCDVMSSIDERRFLAMNAREAVGSAASRQIAARRLRTPVSQPTQPTPSPSGVLDTSCSRRSTAMVRLLLPRLLLLLLLFNVLISATQQISQTAAPVTLRRRSKKSNQGK